MKQLQRFYITIETLLEIAACTGAGRDGSFTIADIEEFIGSRMAEEGVVGLCPVCHNEVVANPYSTAPRIAAHVDKAGGDCVKGRGLAFHLAVGE